MSHAPDAVPQTDAERARACRQRKKAQGLKSVKVDLGLTELAYLNALRVAHDMTLSGVIGLAVTRLIRNEPQDFGDRDLTGRGSSGFALARAGKG
jgi:hypothetical protein